MNILVLDLEMNQPSKKIIEIGYVIVSLDKQEEVLSRNILVNPHEPISPAITSLTGITNEMMETTQCELADAVNLMSLDFNSFSCIKFIATWGNGDFQHLRNRLKVQSDSLYMQFFDLFGYRFLDVKTLYQSWAIANSKPYRSGLRKSMKQMGLEFEGSAHTAVIDARNTWKVLSVLMSKFK